MKIFKKILAGTLALFISASFAFGGTVNNTKMVPSISYAASAVEQQRQELQRALNDAPNVRNTQSYKNAAKKDVDAYENSINQGKAIVNNSSATGQQLYDATKNIDVNRKYLPTSANLILIRASVDNLERKLLGINYLEKTMPNSVKRYKKTIDSAKQNATRAINNAKAYIAKNER